MQEAGWVREEAQKGCGLSAMQPQAEAQAALEQEIHPVSYCRVRARGVASAEGEQYLLTAAGGFVQGPRKRNLEREPMPHPAPLSSNI